MLKKKPFFDFIKENLHFYSRELFLLKSPLVLGFRKLPFTFHISAFNAFGISNKSTKDNRLSTFKLPVIQITGLRECHIYIGSI